MDTAQANTKQIGSHWPRRQISILLTIVALLLWSYSIARAKLDIGFYGLISSYPITFFISIGILTIASAILWVSKEDHGKLLCLQLCLLVASIWLAPVIVRGAHSIQEESYGDLGRFEYIIRKGHYDTKMLWETSWPASWMFWSIGIIVTGTNTHSIVSLIPWIPLIWQILFFFPLFMFFRNTIGKDHLNYCWAAMWLFYLGSWSTETDTGAHVFGIFFVVSILALLTMTPAFKRRSGKFGQQASSIIILAASAIAHLLGAIVNASIMVALLISRRVKAANLVILAAVFIGAWSIYGAREFFASQGYEYFNVAFRIRSATENTIHNPLSGNPSHAAVAVIMILTTALFMAIGFLGTLLAWRLWRMTYADITVAAMAIGSIVPVAAIGGGYGTILFQRFLLFMTPAVAYFAVKLLRLKGTAVLLVIVLIVTMPLSFICRYGNQSLDYLSPGYLSGAYYFQDHTDSGFVIGHLPIGHMKNQESYLFTSNFEELNWEDDRLTYFGGFIEGSPHYICISNHDRAWYTYYWNEPQVLDDIENSLNKTTNCNLVYANPDLKLYVHEAPF